MFTYDYRRFLIYFFAAHLVRKLRRSIVINSTLYGRTEYSTEIDFSRSLPVNYRAHCILVRCCSLSLIFDILWPAQKLRFLSVNITNYQLKTRITMTFKTYMTIVCCKLDVYVKCLRIETTEVFCVSNFASSQISCKI